MKRMKMTTTLVCALTVLAFTTGAWAQDDYVGGQTVLPDEVDFAEAVEHGELVAVFLDDDGQEWETYYDELQNFMWEQLAGVSPEEAEKSLSEGGILTETIMTPKYLVFGKQDRWMGNCWGDPIYEQYTQFSYHNSCGRGCYRFRTSTSGWSHECVWGMYARGSTGVTNYCTWQWADMECWVGNGGWSPSWEVSENCWCEQLQTEYVYHNSKYDLDEWYVQAGDVWRTRYKISSGAWREMRIRYDYIW